jgi:hypothetical protein
VVSAFGQVQVQGGVDQLGIDERAVVAHPDQMVGRMGLQRPGQAGQFVLGRAAMDGDRLAANHRFQRVVGGVGGGRDHDPVHPPRPRHPLDLAHDQRRPDQRHRRSPRQAFGTHAGLEDGEDQGRWSGQRRSSLSTTQETPTVRPAPARHISAI